MLKQQYRTWLEIDKSAIKNNYQIFRNLIPKNCKLCGVVKSNAYGHGLVEFSKELERLGIDFLAADSAVEGLRLRKEGVKASILILGYTLPFLISKTVSTNLSLTISSFDSLYKLPKILGKRKIKIHLKLDTGMHRQGFALKDAPVILNFLNKNKNIILEGSYTHFAAVKNPSFPDETKKQLAVFKQWNKIIAKKGYKPICHASATAGAILYKDTHFDMVRIGIGIYGLWPSKEVKSFAASKLKLKPVLRWKTIISEIKNVSKDEKIGYDFTERLEKDSKIAILPIGYWHGYPRNLSSISYVLIQGKKCKILGRISMDMIVVNVSNVPRVKVGDEACLLGEDNKEEISADFLACLTDTVNYEIITRINPLIKKIYK